MTISIVVERPIPDYRDTMSHSDIQFSTYAITTTRASDARPFRHGDRGDAEGAQPERDDLLVVTSGLSNTGPRPAVRLDGRSAGHGESGRPPDHLYGLDRFAREAIRIVDHSAGNRRERDRRFHAENAATGSDTPEEAGGRFYGHRRCQRNSLIDPAQLPTAAPPLRVPAHHMVAGAGNSPVSQRPR
ncbi:hypothetical protein [Amycolatopsis thermophila]|uniref:Uncharacterized protein n=1 Tax=Amycolatopsis thermophila TaxID=206084 RepID=A0ABU0F540_9PSEU|nr:hypothetical protein [Amycolatopsis thermophila]MDQ0382695.1 hypothetical protein [Amycolatopsis thermophila]